VIVPPRSARYCQCGRIAHAIEALTNAARHSGAQRTQLAFTIEGPRLRLEVVDDGVGLDAELNTSANGVGLAAMAERAAELGGTCSVKPHDAGGTTVVALLPVEWAS